MAALFSAASTLGEGADRAPLGLLLWLWTTCPPLPNERPLQQRSRAAQGLTLWLYLGPKACAASLRTDVLMMGLCPKHTLVWHRPKAALLPASLHKILQLQHLRCVVIDARHTERAVRAALSALGPAPAPLGVQLVVVRSP